MFKAFVACLLCLSTGASLISAQVLKADDSSRSHNQGQGTSQQYHYESHPAPVYSGLSFDLTLVPAAIGAIILLLAFSALIYPLLKSGHSGGWDSGWSRSSKSSNAVMAEKVLTGVEKLYELYNKIK